MENKKNFYIDGKWVAPKSKQEIKVINPATEENCAVISCLLYTSPSPRDMRRSRMPSSA